MHAAAKELMAVRNGTCPLATPQYIASAKFKAAVEAGCGSSGGIVRESAAVGAASDACTKCYCAATQVAMVAEKGAFVDSKPTVQQLKQGYSAGVCNDNTLQALQALLPRMAATMRACDIAAASTACIWSDA